MKYLFYLILVLLLVPLQTTLLPHLSVWNINRIWACGRRACRAVCWGTGRPSRGAAIGWVLVCSQPANFG